MMSRKTPTRSSETCAIIHRNGRHRRAPDRHHRAGDRRNPIADDELRGHGLGAGGHGGRRRLPSPAGMPGTRTAADKVAEAYGNRTRRRRRAPSIGFEDQEGHQAPARLRGEPTQVVMAPRHRRARSAAAQVVDVTRCLRVRRFRVRACAVGSLVSHRPSGGPRGIPPHPVRAWRRLRLQDPAG